MPDSTSAPITNGYDRNKENIQQTFGWRGFLVIAARAYFSIALSKTCHEKV